MKQLAVFASGAGSNALNLIDYFKNSSKLRVTSLYCDNPEAGILQKINLAEIKINLISKKEIVTDGSVLLTLLKKDEIDFILLAGYLSLIPRSVTEAYPLRILNIHPSLLPKFGGKGMYGDKVHIAVLEKQECETGITIHYVNEKYDEGDVFFQSKFSIPEGADINFIKENIRRLEHTYYPIVAETALLLHSF